MTETASNNNKKAVLYCRVSTKEQVDEGNSLVTQERICREYAAKEGFEVVEVFIEKGESAKTANRTELQNLLKFCRAKKDGVQAVIAYKVDRISRNIADYSNIRVQLKKSGVEIKSVTEFFEDTPAGRFMENIIANVSQFDNDVRAERCIGGMREAMNEGRYVWKAPPGYDNLKVNGKSTIAPNAVAPLIREAFEMIALRQYSTEEVRLAILKKGLTSKKGLPIHRGHFFKLMRNPLYKGIIKKFGKTIQGNFDALVAEELFDEVQLILKGRMHKIKHYVHDNPDFPLRRFVLSDNGKQLTGYWAKGKLKKYPYYSFGLRGTTIRKEIVEQKFMTFLSKYALDDAHLAVIKKNLIKHFGAYSTNRKNGKDVIQARIIEINLHIDKLIKLHDLGGITTNILADRTKIHEAEIEDLNQLLVTKSTKEVNTIELMRFAAKVLKDPCKLWLKCSLQEKKWFQVFGFPQGVTFDGIKFRTPKTCSIYKLKELIEGYKFPKADSGFAETNTALTPNLLPSNILLLETKGFWDGVVADLKKFKQMLSH